nr:tetratricopeptide repeat protein [uncultured Desulfobacter sp.]
MNRLNLKTLSLLTVLMILTCGSGAFAGEELASDVPCTCVFNKNRQWNPNRITFKGIKWECDHYNADGTCAQVRRVLPFTWAEQGDAQSQFILGLRYAQGDAVEQNFAEAAKWWQKAAAQGFADAQYNLGVLYARGDGVPKDLSKAADLWRKAADQGYTQAKTALDGLDGKN